MLGIIFIVILCVIFGTTGVLNGISNIPIIIAGIFALYVLFNVISNPFIICLAFGALCVFAIMSNQKSKPKQEEQPIANTPIRNIDYQWLLRKDLSTLKQCLGEPDYSEKISKSTWRLTYLKHNICVNHKTGIVTEVYSNSKPD